MNTSENHRILLIVGAGGLGREIAATARNLQQWREIMFVDDKVEGSMNGMSVWGTSQELKAVQTAFDVVLAIGNPQVKRQVYTSLSENSNLNFPNIVHPGARIHWPETVFLGNGNYIADGSIITTDVTIGDFVLINLACTIGHDALIKDFCSIMPSVNISGGATLEEEVFVGTGAKLIKATTLGYACVIGAGAVVNSDIPKGETWGGVPANPLK